MNNLTAAAAAVNWTTPVTGRLLCLAHGHVWMVMEHGVHGYDQVTGQLRYAFIGYGGVPLAAQPFDGGLMVLSNDGNVYKTEIVDQPVPDPIGRYDAEPGWVEAQAGSVYLYAVKTGLWCVSPRNGGQVTGGVNYGQILDFPILAPGGVLVPRAPNFIDVIDPDTLAVASTIELPGVVMTTGASIQGRCNGPTVCLTSSESSVIAIDTERRARLWQVMSDTKLSRAMAVDAKRCYLGTQDGHVRMLDIVTGKPTGQLRLGTGPIIAVSQDDGLVYAIGSEGTDNFFIYATDPQTGTVVKHPTSGVPQIIGIENGVLYYADAKVVGALRLADIVRGFYAESVLVQDFAFGAGKPVKKAKLHTEITLYDRTGTPFAAQTVMVGSTSPIRIESGGGTFAIDAKKHAALHTDGTGKLRIDMPAGDVDSKGVFRAGLTSPALTLLTSFMDSDDRVVIRPDAQLHNELGKVTQKRLQTAVDYNGNFVIADKYRKDDKAMANVAGMIGASATIVNDSLENRKMLLAAQGQRYLARGCDAESICCCKAGNYGCKLVCNKAFAFGLSPSGSSFGSLDTKAQIEQWLKDHPVTDQGLLMSWGDFWDEVKSGAAKVTNAIIYAARQVEEKAKDVVTTVVTAVIRGSAYTMAFVIDTVEHALAIVQGIFNEIAEGIDKVIEALSLIFEWPAIIALKNDIKANIENTFDRLLKPQMPGGASLLTQVREKGKQAFVDMRGKLDRALTELEGLAGSQSGSNVQSQNAGKNNPAKGGATSNWLQSKLNDNLLSTPATRSRAAAAAPGSVIDIPDFTLPADLQDDISQFLDNLRSQVTDDVRASIDQLKSALDPSNGDLFSQSFRFFLELVRGALHVGLDIVGAVFDGAMRILEKMLTALRSYLRDQTITIPFVSDLYRSFANAELTGLDLACLIVAVPASLAIAATSRGRAVLATAVQTSGLIAGIAQAVWSAVSGVVGVMKALPRGPSLGFKIFFFATAAFGTVARMAFMWSDLEMSEGDALAMNLILWAFPTLAIGVDLVAGLLVSRATAPTVSYVTTGIVGTLGVGAGAMLSMFAGKMKPLAITFNALVAASLIARLGMNFEPDYVKVLTILAIVALIFGSAVVKIADASGAAGSEAPAPALRHAG